MNKKKEGKITLGMLKGKPVTTSVPSISIKFHANAEQLEELYVSDEDGQTNNEPLSSASAPSNTTGTAEQESSPLKYLPRLVKRSTSIDITPNTTIDASPPSDPWRFFSDIKGKITKSVEDKITEIKARNQEEGSPLKSRTVKDSKDNSSVSDSEEFSESSISKTCGVVSTTEGAEMSSDEETPSIEKDNRNKTAETKASTSGGGGGGLRHRFRFMKPKSTREGVVNRTTLVRLYNINADKIEQALPEEETDIESAVDALEDSNLQQQQPEPDPEREEEKRVLKSLEEKFDNVSVDDEQVVVFREVQGNEMKKKRSGTVFAPVGFVDTRPPAQVKEEFSYTPLFIIALFLLLYFLLYTYSSYLAGLIAGITVTYMLYYIKSLLNTPVVIVPPPKLKQGILEVPAVEECQPLTKHEGWVNELPEKYNPHTYHISQTQSVFLRLQGNLLRLSNTRSKIAKRALWNEPKIRPIFTHHRVYNLLGATVTLLPEGLAKKRHWSKKYPICVTLSNDQFHFSSPPSLMSMPSVGTTVEEDKEESIEKPPSKTTLVGSEKLNADKTSTGAEKKPKKKFGFVTTSSSSKKKQNQAMPPQRFSKLTEENEDFAMDSENSRASTPSPPSPPVESVDQPDFQEEVDSQSQKMLLEALDHHLKSSTEDYDDDYDAMTMMTVMTEDWATFTPEEESPTETKLYLFGRTDREKEDWFRRLTAATHRGADTLSEPQATASEEEILSDTLVDVVDTASDYMKFMMICCKTWKKQRNDSSAIEESPLPDIQWINVLAGRILFDCLRDDSFTERVRDKIQRKMGSIKLPYFIEELLVTELSLGRTPPLIHRASKPVLDDRGLWIDLDITYEGEIILILQTKLNLMKLKHPHENSSRNTDKPAMFHSDVEDSAESTSDEDPSREQHHQQHQQQQQQNAQGSDLPVLDASGVPVQGLGGTSNTSKKFMRMVDKIAESKFFKAATEYRYIKRAMEEVSNTDLRLRVNVRELTGTLVLNIPPPPTDRLWVGFRPTPELALSAQPIVGERSITYLRIISWIEKKLVQEFQKLLVIPNMEDLTIPVMSSKLPH